MLRAFKEYRFMLEELAKRDFTKKYKRSILGIFWSILLPILTMFIMRLVFTNFFGATIPHYTTYLFAGNMVYSYFSTATTVGMSALVGNKHIFSKVNLPKYMFVLASNVSSFINFIISIPVFFVFAAIDGVIFSWNFFALLYPILLLLVFNVGVSMILSALYMLFADIQYLYNIVTLLLMYLSAIFYQVESFPENVQRLFLINPVYVYIKYFRVVVIDGNLPSATFQIAALLYAAIALGIGLWVLKRNDQRFMYYV